MPPPTILDRKAGRARRVALGLTLVLAIAAGAVQAGSDVPDRIAEARATAAASPRRGLTMLRLLRDEAVAQQRMDLRLAADEAECRVLSDLDDAKALGVAEAGLAAAGADPPQVARDAWLRLRACRAGVMLDMGELGTGRGELEALLSLTRAASDASIHALAQLERGVYRSRNGDLLGGQQDLIEACEQLKTHGPERDRDLCLGHLANHYRRMGDADEAMRILLALRNGARRHGATYDDAIYTFSMAQVLQIQQRWSEAMDNFREAAAANERQGDSAGMAYAEHGIAVALLELQRPQEALPYAERSLEHLDAVTDPRQFEHGVITRADALAALDRVIEANAALDRIEAAVRKRGEPSSLEQWLSVRARVMRSLGRWHEAYQALADAKVIEDRLQQQRLSQQAARLRMQFNRARDTEDLSALRQLNEQGQRLRQTQALALGLFAILLAAVVVVAVRKYRQARHLHSLASTDELTGLVNRRALFAYVDDALERRRREGIHLAVLMIDVDHFKRINDTHGHAVGDQVLRHVARVLASGLRERDRLGRLGGEEFLAVLPEATVADAQHVAERMRSAIASTPLIAASSEVRFTVSIGVAGVQAAEAVGTLIARADAALYRAKNAGRNAVAVDGDNTTETASAA